MDQPEIIDVEATEEEVSPTHTITIEASKDGVRYETDVPSAQLIFYLEVVKDLVIKDITRDPSEV